MGVRIAFSHKLCVGVGVSGFGFELCASEVKVDIQEGRCKATWKREFKLPWREAGPPNLHDDKVDSDQ